MKAIHRTTITTPLGPKGNPLSAPSINSSPPNPLKTKQTSLLLQTVQIYTLLYV